MPGGCLLGEAESGQELASVPDFCHPGRGPSPGTRADRVSEHLLTIPVASAEPRTQVLSPQQLTFLQGALALLTSQCSQ